ncbi:MAG: hypothetical protein OXE40_05575 [Gammaproteobacteria bacterium]|nr:hypothetical protein [Gammaproteobacteria bacterium]
MPDPVDIRIERAPERALVSLRVSRQAASNAARRLHLAPPLRTAGEDPQSLWLGPDHWLLASPQQTASALIERCETGLGGLLHNAVDLSAAFTVLRLAGGEVRDVLASGAGLDFRGASFPQGGCRPTRFAQVATVIVATGTDEFELYVDRGYDRYLRDWLEDAALIAARAAR